MKISLEEKSEQQVGRFHWHNRGKALLHFFTASSTFFVVAKWLVIGAHNEQTQAAVPEGRVRLAKIDLSPDSVGNDLRFFIHFSQVSAPSLFYTNGWLWDPHTEPGQAPMVEGRVIIVKTD
jgi:hypothetical protein